MKTGTIEKSISISYSINLQDSSSQWTSIEYIYHLEDAINQVKNLDFEKYDYIAIETSILNDTAKDNDYKSISVDNLLVFDRLNNYKLEI